MKCAYCGRPSEKEYAIDVTLPLHGDCDVYLCNRCGRNADPSIEDLQERVEAIDPLIFEIKLVRGEIGIVPESATDEEVTRLIPIPF